jgi:hypothetical protein
MFYFFSICYFPSATDIFISPAPAPILLQFHFCRVSHPPGMISMRINEPFQAPTPEKRSVPSKVQCLQGEGVRYSVRVGALWYGGMRYAVCAPAKASRISLLFSLPLPRSDFINPEVRLKYGGETNSPQPTDEPIGFAFSPPPPEKVNSNRQGKKGGRKSVGTTEACRRRGRKTTPPQPISPLGLRFYSWL